MVSMELMNYAWVSVWPITAPQCPIFMNGWISFTFFSSINAKRRLLKGQLQWKSTKDPHRSCWSEVSVRTTSLSSNDRLLHWKGQRVFNFSTLWFKWKGTKLLQNVVNDRNEWIIEFTDITSNCMCYITSAKKILKHTSITGLDYMCQQYFIQNPILYIYLNKYK